MHTAKWDRRRGVLYALVLALCAAFTIPGVSDVQAGWQALPDPASMGFVEESTTWAGHTAPITDEMPVAGAPDNATGAVSLDRTVYPVPFGIPADFAPSTSTIPDGRSIFPIHQTGMDGTPGLQAGEFINGDLTIHVRVYDEDFDISSASEDALAMNTAEGVGPVKISVIRGTSTVVLGYVGGESTMDGKIGVGSNMSVEEMRKVTQFGPITEIAPDAGIFEADITVKFADGPASTKCPDHNMESRFITAAPSGQNYCILQGDILQVEYKDSADASGDPNTVTDSATFDLRNGVLQSDRSVYMIGSDIVLTLMEPDFDLDTDQAETYDLDLIEWDSDAATLTLGSDAAFNPYPSDFRETGDSTGIFQIVIETPVELKGDRLGRGEEIELEYADWGPSGSDYVGDEGEDVNLTIFTSNYGATLELDQKTYTWTDKVFITLVAPDYNFDSDLVDKIGDTDDDSITISTSGANLGNYKLAETGTNTGIFRGEVILTGFTHDADGDTTTGDANGNDVLDRPPSGSGPTNGMLPASRNDDITVSFEYSDVETITASALIRWNIGEIQWLGASHTATGTGVVRVVDADMNWNPNVPDSFEIDVWSDSDLAGIDLMVDETNEATGIFEGTVFFTPTDKSSSHTLRVAGNDTATAEYEDNTLPGSYTTAGEPDLYAATVIVDNTNRQQPGATVELDQKVYSWTDKVFITIVAPDHNLDSNKVDEIGNTSPGSITISTREDSLYNYKLVETGMNTGIFTGEIILTGFTHDADGDTTTGTNGNDVLYRTPSGMGPTDGTLPVDDDSGITVSFEFSEDETIVGSALIRWSIGEIQWLEASYPATGTGVVRVVDADMNLDPEAVDNFEVDVWSDSDSGGIDLMVTETNEATGIFEGTVFFTVTDESSGHTLRVAGNDTITAEYEDNTLPYPYTTADELDISATTFIGDTATVRGTVFSDTNGNGVRDAGEPGMEGYKMYLVPPGDSDMTFSGLPYRHTTTNADGEYSFEDVVPMMAWIVQTLYFPPGHTVPDPNSSWFMHNTPQPGETVQFDVAFYPVREPDQVRLDLTAYHDADGNGVRDAGEEPVPGVNVDVYTYVTAQSRMVTTGDDGTASARFVPADLLVQVILPDGYSRATSPMLVHPDYTVPGAMVVDDPERGAIIPVMIGLATTP